MVLSLTSLTLLFSGTANSSFSLGVFTVTLIVLGESEEEEDGAGGSDMAV